MPPHVCPTPAVTGTATGSADRTVPRDGERRGKPWRWGTWGRCGWMGLCVQPAFWQGHRVSFL